MDIDLGLLRTIEREKEIPFDELVRIIEQAILTAYGKHTTGAGEAPDGARAVLDRKTGHVAVFIPAHRRRGRRSSARRRRLPTTSAASPPSPRSRSSASACATSPTTPCSGEFRGKEGDIVAGVVQQGPNPRMIHVDLGSIEAILPPEEQVPSENYAARLAPPGLRHERVQGHQGPADHRVAHPPRARPQAVRARGARDRVGPRRDRLARPRGRPPHEDRRQGERPVDQRQGRLHRRARPPRARRHRGAQRREDRHRRLRPRARRSSSRTPCRPPR